MVCCHIVLHWITFFHELQVVTRVVNKGEAKLIKPLSLAAAHCMGEVKLSSETKETEHPYKNDIHKEVNFSMFRFFTIYRSKTDRLLIPTTGQLVS